MRRTNEKQIEKLVMSTYLCKYKICSIFLLYAIGSSVVSAQGFCELMSYVKPSTPFSFEKQVMKLRGFTYYENDGHLVMFYDDSFQLISDGELKRRLENIQIFDNSTFSTIASFPFLRTYLLEKFSPGEVYDTMYYLDANPSFIFAKNLILLAFSNKRSIALDSSFFQWTLPITTPIKLITDSLNINMKVYANGVDPVAKKGIIFYNFWFSAGNFFFYEFSYKMISDARDMESESYFYLKLTSDPRGVEFVHPKKGNVTAAQLYPLAQRAMPGYIYNRNLFLFDVDLGCVYVLPNFNFINLNAIFEQKSGFKLGRRNIPFEKFFICEDKYDIPNKFSFLSPDRCETKIDSGGQVQAGRSDTGERNVGENDNTTDYNVLVLTGSYEEPSRKMRNNTFFAIVTILVVICLVVLCLLLIWRHKKRNKNSKNQSNVEKARSKKTTSVGQKGGGAGGDLKVSSKSKSKIKQRSQQSSGGGVSSKKSAKSSKSLTSTPVTTSSDGGGKVVV